MTRVGASWLGAIVLVLVLAACGASQANALVTYQRTWSDGFHEELTILDDGRVTMHHGETLERLTISAADLQRVRDALSAGLAEGDDGDGMVRSVILADGTSHSPVRVVPGTATGLLEQFLTTHSLAGSPPPSGAPSHAHTMGGHTMATHAAP